MKRVKSVELLVFVTGVISRCLYWRQRTCSRLGWLAKVAVESRVSSLGCEIRLCSEDSSFVLNVPLRLESGAQSVSLEI